MDTVACVTFGKTEFESDVFKKAADPAYNYLFVLCVVCNHFTLMPFREIHEASPKIFTLTVNDSKKRDTLGLVDFLVSDFFKAKDVRSWFTLSAAENGKSKK